MRNLILALPLLAVAACSTTTTGSTTTHAQAASALQTAYTTAHGAEVAYCGTQNASMAICTKLADLDETASVAVALFVAEPNNTSVEAEAVTQMAALSGELAIIAVH